MQSSVISWGVILILTPFAGAFVCFLWGRAARIAGTACVIAVVAAAAGLGRQMFLGGVYHHRIGGWGAPLGIELYADGLSLLMLGTTAVVGLAVSVYSVAYFEQERSERFWPLWLSLLGALNALFLSADAFNLYVTLELLGLAAVVLTSLAGDREAIGGALRYLFAALLGSLAYLLGVALLYHDYATLDLSILAVRAEDTLALRAALGLMTAGLILKTALFPMHFWLPSAHTSAPVPVSALLSALVVKASFYILLRLWLTIFMPVGEGVAGLLGLLGALAILWGSVQALRQSRLKMLVAYSTVAQIGYLFLSFPLAIAAGEAVWNAAGYLVVSHAMAKAAMFLAAGNILRHGGHDLVADLDQVVQRLPLTTGAFALAGVSIVGLPPSGGFIGKWILLEVSLAQGRWDIAVVIIVGGLLAAAYVFKVLGLAFTEAPTARAPRTVPARMEWAALSLAGAAILLGFLAPAVLALVGIGEPFAPGGAAP